MAGMAREDSPAVLGRYFGPIAEKAVAMSDNPSLYIKLIKVRHQRKHRWQAMCDVVNGGVAHFAGL